MRFKILQRYALRELLWVFLLAVIVITAVVCFALLVTFVMKYSPSPAFLLSSLKWLACQGMFIILPFSFLITVTLVYGRLSRDNEVMAIEASGTSVFFFVGPGFLVGLVVVFVSIVFSDYLTPYARTQLDELIQKNVGTLIQKRIQAKPEFDRISSVHIVYEKYDHENDQLLNARIRHFDPETQQLKADIRCQRMIVEVADEGKVLELKMFNPRGIIYDDKKKSWSVAQVANNPDPLIKPFSIPQRRGQKRFKMMNRYELQIARREIVNDLRVARKVRKLGYLEGQIRKHKELDRQFAVLQKQLALLKAQAPDSEEKTPQMRRLQDRIVLLVAHSKNVKKQIDDFGGSPLGLKNKIEYYRKKLRKLDTNFCKRYSFAFSTLAFALVGMPLAIMMRRAHMLAAFAISCLFVFVVFWPLTMVATNLSEMGKLSPWLAMSIPHIALGIPGIILNLKLLAR